MIGYPGLAAAVIAAAFLDIRKPRDPKVALDAADFLLRRLWQDSLWQAHLRGTLIPGPVRRRVAQVMRPEVWKALPKDLKRLAA
jgi:hypothetical protein